MARIFNIGICVFFHFTFFAAHSQQRQNNHDMSGIDIIRADSIARQAIKKEIASLEHTTLSWSKLNQKVLEYEKSGEWTLALAYCKKALEKAETEYGKKHLNYSKSLNNLASIDIELGEYEEAEVLLLSALVIDKEILGGTNAKYAQDLDNLAALYIDLGQYAKAETFFLEELDIHRNFLKGKHRNYPKCLNNLAALYSRTKEYQKAEDILHEAIALSEKISNEGEWDYVNASQIWDKYIFLKSNIKKRFHCLPKRWKSIEK